MTTGNPWWAQSPSPHEEARTKTTAEKGVFGVVIAFFLIIASMVAFLVAGPDPQKPYKSQFGSVAYPAKTESLIAECGDIFTYTPDENHYGVLPADFFEDPESLFFRKRTIPVQPMLVPAYGYFIEQDPENPVFNQKFYSLEDVRNISRSEHSAGDVLEGITEAEYLSHLWNGGKIIWYSSDVEQDTLDSIAIYVSERDDVIALPWLKQLEIPNSRSFAYSSWSATRSCDLWDSDVATEFMDFADQYNSDRDIQSPPPARINLNGELNRIDVQRW